jgi:hypothetical protein
MAQTFPPVLLRPQQLNVPVDAEALQRQYDALAAMPKVTVRYSRQGSVVVLDGPTPIALDAPRDGKHDAQLAREVMKKFGDVLLATGREVLTLTQSSELMPGGIQPNTRSLSFSESIDGIEVAKGYVGVSIEEPYGMVISLGATFLADRNLPRTPRISAADAQRRVVEALEATSQAERGKKTFSSEAHLAYFGANPDNPYTPPGQPVWVLGDQSIMGETFYADALEGTIVARDSPNVDGPVPPFEGNRDCVPVPQGPAVGAYRGCAGLPHNAVPERLATGCRKRRVRWEPVPDATIYTAMLVPVDYGWAFAHAVVSGQYISCTIDVPIRSELRVRACNGCGCSDWSEPILLEPDC